MSSRKILLPTIFLTCVATVAGVRAQQPESQVSAQEKLQRKVLTVPKSYLDRMRDQGAVLELSLKEAIRLALLNNLEIAIENYNEDLNREQVVKTRGFYDPTIGFTVGWSSRTSPTTSILQAGQNVNVNTSDTFTLNSSLRQNVLGGGALEVTFNNTRSETNSVFFTINPRFDSSFNVSFTQPLWRGFLKTNTERQIKVFNLEREISDTQFKQRVVEVVQQVENQYWEAVFSVENFETQRRSMELAIIQHQNNRKRVEIGVMAPIEITSSEAEVARRQQTLIQSEVQIINAQNGLKRLLAPDPNASIWKLALAPTDRPQVRDVTLTLEQAIQKSVEHRPELERIRLQMEQNEVNRDFYKKEGKPTVNLRANFGSVGAAGQLSDSSDPRLGSFGNAWGQVFGFDFRSWGIFADVQIPLRNRSNAADLATVAIQDRQLQSTMKNQQQLVIVEVRNAFETIATRKQSLESARVARQLSEEQLEGENKRFEAGLSTNFAVLRFQRDLAESQSNELRAEIDYQLALIALEKAMYTIIGDNDIVLARGR
ncbi:MAG: TolC family protein [Acidobacteriota bacterium]